MITPEQIWHAYRPMVLVFIVVPVFLATFALMAARCNERPTPQPLCVRACDRLAVLECDDILSRVPEGHTCPTYCEELRRWLGAESDRVATCVASAQSCNDVEGCYR